jgi:hypothetical protein
MTVDGFQVQQTTETSSRVKAPGLQLLSAMFEYRKGHYQDRGWSWLNITTASLHIPSNSFSTLIQSFDVLCPSYCQLIKLNIRRVLNEFSWLPTTARLLLTARLRHPLKNTPCSADTICSADSNGNILLRPQSSHEAWWLQGALPAKGHENCVRLIWLTVRAQ